jgi:hypothetical protein
MLKYNVHIITNSLMKIAPSFISFYLTLLLKFEAVSVILHPFHKDRSFRKFKTTSSCDK